MLLHQRCTDHTLFATPSPTHCRKPVWAALARAAAEELQQRQFTPLPSREALGILQGRKLGVARLRLLPKRTGECASPDPAPSL